MFSHGFFTPRAAKWPVHSRILGASVALIAAWSSSRASPRAVSWSPAASKAMEPSCIDGLIIFCVVLLYMCIYIYIHHISYIIYIYTYIHILYIYDIIYIYTYNAVSYDILLQTYSYIYIYISYTYIYICIHI